MVQNNYPTRLAYLMSKFDVTAKELAEAIHVDHSLVSKWRNNTRTISPHSEHPDNIAAFFLVLDLNLDLSLISEIVNEEFPHFAHSSPDEKKEIIKQWLVKSSEKKKQKSDDYARLLELHGRYAAKFDVFKGIKGKRRASDRLMKLALSLPPGQELLLYSKSPRNYWHADEKIIYLKWKKQLQKFTAKGNAITIIHDLSNKSLDRMLIAWLPEEFSNRFKAYGFSDGTNTFLEPMMMLLRNQAALVSSITDDTNKEQTYTHFFTDPVTVLQCQLVYDFLLSKCQLLYDKYTLQDVNVLLNILKLAAKQEHNSYLFCTLSMQTVQKYLLPVIHVKEEEVLKEIAGNALKTLKNNYCRIILSLKQFEEIYLQFSETAGTAEPQLKNALGRFLQYLLKLLDEYSLFQIALTNDLPVNNPEEICLYVKENTVTFIHSPQHDPSQPATVTSHEPLVTSAYFTYLDKFWASIPPINRNKDWVRKTILQLLNLLS